MALLAIVALAALGSWQLRRNAWRHEWLAARNARIDLPPVPIADVLGDPKAFADRRATARGQLVVEESITARNPEGGVRILTPLVLSALAAADAPLLLVDRGIVPGPGIDSFLAEDAARPPGEVEVSGLLLPLAVQPVRPASAPSRQREWLRFDPARPDAVAALQAQLSRPLAPVLLQAEAGEASALPRGGITRPVSPVDHVSYAIFWFCLAAATAANWVAFGFHQAREARRAADRARLAPQPVGAPTEGNEP